MCLRSASQDLTTLWFFTHYSLLVLRAEDSEPAGNKATLILLCFTAQTADFNSASVQCYNCTVRCKTTKNRHRKTLSNLADQFPELQSSSSTLGKNKIFWRLLMPQGTHVHISFRDLNLRTCLCCTLHLKSAAYPHQHAARNNDCFLERIIPGQHGHTVLWNTVLLHGTVLDTCTSISGCQYAAPLCSTMR